MSTASTVSGSMAVHRNNFSLLRLLFAALVVLAHAPELADGDRSREIATSIWGTVSFGTIAVDGFFLVSGYLITKSFENSRGLFDYLKKRVFRIYPGFLSAFIICVFLVGPLGGAPPLDPILYLKNLVYALILAEPAIPGIFATLPYPSVNGPMWTIAYEFRCYLLVGFLGAVGLLKFRSAILLAGLLCLVATGLGAMPPLPIVTPHFGTLDTSTRFVGIFLMGASFYLFRDRIVLRGSVAAICLVTLSVALFFAPVAELALATLGGYALFWFAFNAPAVAIKEDISYGLYLYAWPIMNVIYYREITGSPWVAAAMTLVLAAIAGFLSWRLIEKPALNAARMRTPRPDPPATSDVI